MKISRKNFLVSLRAACPLPTAQKERRGDDKKLPIVGRCCFLLLPPGAATAHWSWKLFHSWNHFHEISFSLPLWHLDSVLALQLVLGMSFATLSLSRSHFLSLSLSVAKSHLPPGIKLWHVATKWTRINYPTQVLVELSQFRPTSWVNSNTMRLRLIFYNFAHDFQFLLAFSC